MAGQRKEKSAEQKITEALRNGAVLLDLSGTRLTELPASIGQLTQLQSLDLSHNHLTELPDSLGQLTQLQSLDVIRNQLTELPESIGQLTRLKSLDPSNNRLTEFPESLGQLTQLQSLDLSANQLTELPRHHLRYSRSGLEPYRNCRNSTSGRARITAIGGVVGVVTATS